MAEPLVALVTAGSQAEAERIASALVEEGLAACVNVIPGVVSLYRWQGKLQRDAECLLVAKTRRDVLDDLVFVEEFSVPEVWHYLGICYQNLAMPVNARECFNQALARDPGFLDARNALEALKA